MSIVFGTTLLPESEPFAEIAARLARAWSTPLRLVHVSEDPRAPIVLGTDEEHLLGEVRAELRREAERLEELAGGPVQTHLAGGDVVEALVSVARFEHAALVLLGSPDEPQRSLFGATAERVCRRSPAPVLTLREPRRLAAWLAGERELRVLIGSDLGRAAHAARGFALRLAQAGAVSSTVVHVARPSDAHARLGLPAPTDPHRFSPEAHDVLLRDLERRAPAGESAQLEVVAARGSADVRLVTLADEGDYDLVLVGQRKQSLVEQLWYGSVGRGVLRASPVSVACVPSRADDPAPTLAPPRVILVGTDLEEPGQRALAQALALLGRGGRLHLAHVVEPVPSPAEAFAHREQAWHRLTRTGTDEAREAGVSVERHLLEGAPAAQLTALAQRVGADLLVVAARSRHAVTRALLGSVARSLVESAELPVLVVPVPVG